MDWQVGWKTCSAASRANLRRPLIAGMSILTIIRQRRHRRSQIRSSAQQRSQRVAFGFGFAFSAILVLAVLAAVLAYSGLTSSLPPVEQLPILLNPKDGQLLQPTRLYDRTGQHLLAVLAPGNGARIYAQFDQMPQTLINATVAIAEPDFWSSPGYVFGGWQKAETHPTLAQQLVSELLLGNRPAALLRAIHERMLAAQITSQYGRQQVLEWYLNGADYGHYAYGAEAAAQFYLGKSVTQIDLGEAALLAAISQAPAINPIDAPRATEQNRLQVIRNMLEQGMINPDEAAQTVRNPPTARTQLPAEEGAEGVGSIAPAFINFALSQLDLEFGAGRVERGGLTITTSLDYDLQLQAICAAQTQLLRLAGSDAEVAAADGSACTAANLLPALPSSQSQPGISASLVMLDPRTGQVLAAVGDLHAGVQSATLGSHPAGTIITPFIYLTGFSRGLNPASLSWDIPGNSPVPGQVYHGPVRLRTALANDYLPPAVNLLAQMGQESVQSIAAPFGLQIPPGLELLQQDFNITPLSLAEAYGILANNGTLAGQGIANNSLHASVVLKVNSIDHSIWADWSAAQTRLLLSPQLDYLMNQVLSDEAARWPLLGHPNPLEIGRPAGAKLANSLDLSGAWTVGYTPQRVAVVWIGTGSGAGQAAGSISGPISPLLSADLWHALMQYAVRDLPSASWDMPSGIVTAAVCDPSGLLPTQACPNVVNEVFLDGRQPVQTDTLYQTFQINTETGLLATVFTPPELIEKHNFMVVPPQARLWARDANIATPPTAYDTFQMPLVQADVHISSPVMFTGARGKLELRGSAAGANFARFRLEYGQGLYPGGWVQIGADNQTPVTDGRLGEWDTTALNGLYSLRLMVVRSDQRVDQAVVQVTLDNTPPQVAITYPQAGQTIRAAQEPQVALQAQASDAFLTEVDFYIDAVLVGKSSVAPFGIVWTARPGQHVLKVVAADQAGNTTGTETNFTVGK
jgi:membrane carboxypeptidase/penicillin-binding protein